MTTARDVYIYLTQIYLRISRTPGVLSSPSLSSSSVSGPAWFRGLGPDKGAVPPNSAFMALLRMFALADASPSSSSSSGSRCSIRTLNFTMPKRQKHVIRKNRLTPAEKKLRSITRLNKTHQWYYDTSVTQFKSKAWNRTLATYIQVLSDHVPLDFIR